VSVVEYLATKGLSPERLAATGFGEFQPLELGTTDEAFRRNRRIEFKITER
jgi:chemotaxis protein MotB